MNDVPRDTGWQRSLDGMLLSWSNKPDEWKAIALDAVHRTAKELLYLTADDVWERFPPGVETWNGSALGMVMRIAKANGWIEQTGRVKAAVKPTMHCKYRPIWRSCLHDDPKTGQKRLF